MLAQIKDSFIEASVNCHCCFHHSAWGEWISLNLNISSLWHILWGREWRHYRPYWDEAIHQKSLCLALWKKRQYKAMSPFILWNINHDSSIKNYLPFFSIQFSVSQENTTLDATWSILTWIAFCLTVTWQRPGMKRLIPLRLTFSFRKQPQIWVSCLRKMFACLLLRLVYFYFNCWIFIFLCWIKSNHSWNKAEAIRCMTWWLGGHCWSATNLRSHECSNTLLVWRSPPCTPCWHWKAICHRTFTTLWLSFWHAPCLHHKIRFWDKSLFDSVWQQSDRQIAKKNAISEVSMADTEVVWQSASWRRSLHWDSVICWLWRCGVWRGRLMTRTNGA